VVFAGDDFFFLPEVRGINRHGTLNTEKLSV
jgi:hypothetical protein